MWLCPAELVGDQKVGGANFTNLKAMSTDIASLSLMIQLIGSIYRWCFQRDRRLVG